MSARISTVVYPFIMRCSPSQLDAQRTCGNPSKFKFYFWRPTSSLLSCRATESRGDVRVTGDRERERRHLQRFSLEERNTSSHTAVQQQQQSSQTIDCTSNSVTEDGRLSVPPPLLPFSLHQSFYTLVHSIVVVQGHTWLVVLSVLASEEAWRSLGKHRRREGAARPRLTDSPR